MKPTKINLLVIIFILTTLINISVRAEPSVQIEEAKQLGETVQLGHDGNAGNLNKMKFYTCAYKILEVIRDKQGLFPKIDIDILEEKIGTLNLVFVEKKPIVNNKKENAANYPEQNEIHFYKKSWEETLVGKIIERYKLVAHELLGLIGVNDKTFKKSLKIIYHLPNDLGGIFRWSCAGNCYVNSDGSQSGIAFEDMGLIVEEADSAGQAYARMQERCNRLVKAKYWHVEGILLAMKMPSAYEFNNQIRMRVYDLSESSTISTMCVKNF